MPAQVRNTVASAGVFETHLEKLQISFVVNPQDREPRIEADFVKQTVRVSPSNFQELAMALNGFQSAKQSLLR
jgi:hypothetical protein